MNGRSLALVAMLPFVACDQPADEPADGVIEPSFDDKSDEFSGVEDGGVLSFGDTVDGTFDEDFQFFEYTFRAREDATIDIEITQAGSSSGLDTTLFLYRNNPGEAPSRIAVDDDAGGGALSRIRDFRLFSDGEYTIVVGTKNSTGRGNFRLSLRCPDGSCEPESPPMACHPVFADALDECLHELSQETDFEVAAFDLLDDCRSWVKDSTEAICPDDDEPLCEDSGPAFAACMDHAEAVYVRPASGLSRTDAVEIDSVVERVAASDICSGAEEAGCLINGTLYRYDGDAPNAAALLAFAREQSVVGRGAMLDQELESDWSTLQRILGNYIPEFAIDDAAEALGLDVGEAQVSLSESHSEFSWNHGDCNGAIVTALFPTAQRVLIIEDVFCAG